MSRFGTISEDVFVICLVKGSERYVWLYHDTAEALRAFGRAASNPELSFSFYDCAVLSQKVLANLEQNPHDS